MEDLRKRFQREFRYNGYSFEEMVGEAHPLNDAIGRIAINFADLENEVSYAITHLLKTTHDKGLLITSEMAFKAKVNVLAALMKTAYSALEVKDPTSEPDFQDLLYMCNKSEEMRNRLLHSSWVYRRAEDSARRIKRSAKTKRGYVQEDEPLTPGQVLDMADYIIYTAISIDEFFECEFENYVRSNLWGVRA